MESSTRDRQSRKLKRRRVIERPRLFALLDESPNRIRTLVAPAGYGKTTLAEQWVARDGRRGAWFKARSASTDVAALALGLARAASELVPGCDERLREHLRAVPNPGERVDVLAEILGEELAGWQPTDWLVLDEYQELVGATDAESFVEELAALCPVQLLIASRQRPTWVTGRRILYGDVLELNQTVLAMDTREAAELLEGRSAASASGLVALANGWPAVIALASVTDAEIDGDAEVPDALYRFFAEEVFDAWAKRCEPDSPRLRWPRCSTASSLPCCSRTPTRCARRHCNGASSKSATAGSNCIHWLGRFSSIARRPPAPRPKPRTRVIAITRRDEIRMPRSRWLLCEGQSKRSRRC